MVAFETSITFWNKKELCNNKRKTSWALMFLLNVTPLNDITLEKNTWREGDIALFDFTPLNFILFLRFNSEHHIGLKEFQVPCY